MMNPQENILILKQISKKISNKLHCDRHGSCVHFAEIFVEEVNDKYPELLNDFDVIEGYVNAKFGNGIPQEHTWIRLNNGEIIDPTFSQFDKYDKNAQYSKRRTKVYSGQEYYDEGKEGSWFSERRKQLPSSVFKEGKRESIRKVLREETKLPLIIRRRINTLEDLLYNHMATSYAPHKVCRYKNEDDLLMYVIASVIEDMYYRYFDEEISDLSKEWEDMYRLMEKYITDEFGDKIKNYYHIHCGD